MEGGGALVALGLKKTLMAGVTGHHWVTHGVLNLIVFLILGWVLAKTPLATRTSVGASIASVVGATVLGGLVTAGFFL